MSKICTSIEQSKKLIELGIDVKTADMCWSIDIPDLPTLLAYPFTDCNNLENKIPAWSLTALLSILSTIIDYSYEFVFLKQTSDGRGNRLKNVYRCSVDMKDIWNIKPLDAVFEMVVWLKEMGRYE